MNILFKDTATAFAYKSNKELKKARFLFSTMAYLPKLTVGLAKISHLAIQWKIPFVRTFIKKTFFEHFCGGETREDCIPAIHKLASYQVDTALDFGVEGQNSTDAWDKMTQEIIQTIFFFADEEKVPVISLKLTAISSFELLEKYSFDPLTLSNTENDELNRLKLRITQICTAAQKANKMLYLDAEESWIQTAIDDLALEMMCQFNTQKAVLFNTYQLYLKSSLNRLRKHHERCMENQVFFAAKLVRGAYMDKENYRAQLLGQKSPMQPSKKATDYAYDEAVDYCLHHYDFIFFAAATHNEESNAKLLKLIEQKNPPSHHIHFCQLYGMSDHITFPLANKGLKVMKYLPFGQLEETLPYMIRRAEENTSVTKDMSSELSRIREELKRRNSLANHHRPDFVK